MSKTIVELSMSLDGFVAGPNDGPDNPLGDGGKALFAWYNSGDVELRLYGSDMVFKVSRVSADFLQDTWNTKGVMVAGRRMFDIAHAWGGHPPGGAPCFIVTHHPPQEWLKEDTPFVFVSDGVESAIRQAQRAAGDGLVSIGSASIARQALAAGLLDEIHIDVAPVLLGSGVRLFDKLGVAPVQLQQIRAVEASGVTHLRYRVVK
jgi:dihydrofolate reductase